MNVLVNFLKTHAKQLMLSKYCTSFYSMVMTERKHTHLENTSARTHIWLPAECLTDFSHDLASRKWRLVSKDMRFEGIVVTDYSE